MIATQTAVKATKAAPAKAAKAPAKAPAKKATPKAVKTTKPAAAADGFTLHGEATVPLGQLVLSPRNARKVPHTRAHIATLAASIEAIGLVSPLTVTPTGDDFAVVAGGGRLAALQLLREQGKANDLTPVRCVTVADDLAVDVSLAENVIRAGMHPADK